MPFPAVKITVLGSGTSVGIPMIGCRCDVCTSSDPRDQRLRPSIVVSYGDRRILIDTPPDFRTQALRANIAHVDAILFTHAHADHVMGLDDVRPFNFHHKTRIPIYAAEPTMTAIRRSFPYIFDDTPNESSTPKLDPHLIESGPIDLFGMEFMPVPILHGRQMILGFRFGAAAYLTDHSAIPEASLEMLGGLDVLFLDALRYRPHPTHSTVEQSIRTVESLKPRRAFFTHISHDLGHERAEQSLPSNIRLAYDGLELDVEGRP